MKVTRLRRWQFQEAKAKPSQVVDDMLDKGPQIITRHGKDIAAIIAIEDLPKVIAPGGMDTNRKGAILEMLHRCPYPLSELNIERDRTPISTESIFE